MENDDLELSRLKVHHSDILNHILQARHKFQMCGVLLQIVFAVLLALKLADESM